MTFIQHEKSLATHKKYYSVYYQISTGRKEPASKFFNHRNKPFSSLNFILTPAKDKSLDGEIIKLKRKAKPLYRYSFIYKHLFFAMPVYQQVNRQAVSFFFSSNGLTIQNSFAFHSYDQKWNHRFIITIQNFRILLNKNETQFPGGAFNILAKRERFIRNSLKGILLVNFPEKEKNFLIKNLAAENKIALITQSASLLLKDSRNMDDLLGVDDPIQILFDKVKTCIPCLCFINNLDRIGKQRYQQEQKSLHWLNNSISLSLDKHFTSDAIFNTINTKQNFDFLDSTSWFPSKLNDRPNLTRVPSNKKFSLNTKFNLNKAFGFNHDFKNTAPTGILKNIEKFQITRFPAEPFKNFQNHNQNVFKYLTLSNSLDGEITRFNQLANKNKLQSIRPFFNLLVKLSIGSQDFMYLNSKKPFFLKLVIKKNIPLPKPPKDFLLTPSNKLDGETTKRENGSAGKHVSDNVSKFKTSYYHRLPYWLLKNNFFFQYKINIGKIKLFNWFYDKKKKEEDRLTSLKATVNPLLLQMAFCQSQYNTTNPIFAKCNRLDPQTNLENPSKIPAGEVFKNSLTKSNATKVYGMAPPENKLKRFSKTNIYDIVSLARAETHKKKPGFFPLVGFKDLGKINTDQRDKISKIFGDSNMQSFNSKTPVFSPAGADQYPGLYGEETSFEKTKASHFNDMPINIESTGYDLLKSTKQEPNKNNSFKITETETIKRTALLKFLQILDGFHTTRVYKYQHAWLKPFSHIKDFGLTNNPLPNDPGYKEATSWKSKTPRKLFFLILARLTRPVLLFKLGKRDNIKNMALVPPVTKMGSGMLPYLKQLPLFAIKNWSSPRINPGTGRSAGHFLKRRVVLNTGFQNNIRFLETNWSLPSGWFPFQITDRRVQSQAKNNEKSYALQKKTCEYLRVTSRIPKWEVYLKNQPSGKSLNLLCVWPSYIDDIMGPLNQNDSASYLLPEYFQLLGHGPKLKKQGITLIASTNNLATLDAALLRPGRFDTIINFSHTLSSIYQSSKILKHSPSLIQNKNFSLRVSLAINKLTPSVSFTNISKTITNQFYPQVTVLDIPSQSISTKTFIDVSVFMQYKLWWSFNNEKLLWFRLYQSAFLQKSKRPSWENHALNFKKFWHGVFKWNMFVVILIPLRGRWKGGNEFPIKKIKHVIYSFIRILRTIYSKFFGGADPKGSSFPVESTPRGYFSVSKEKLVGTPSENSSFRLSEIQTLPFAFISTKVAVDSLKSLNDKEKQPSTLSLNSHINQTSFTQKEGTSFPAEPTRRVEAFSREVLTSRIVNLGLPKNLFTLNGALHLNYIFNQEARMVSNDKNKRLGRKTSSMYGNAQNPVLVPSPSKSGYWSARTEWCNFHMQDGDMFLKYNRSKLFCRGDFDYKTYSKSNFEMVLIKPNNPNHLKSEFRIFAESIGLNTAESNFFPVDGFRNNNINSVMLTKYNEIYKLKKIKLTNGSAGKQSFFNLHPFTQCMLKRWSQVTKSNKLKQHLKISLVNSDLPWKNEIYNGNHLDSSNSDIMSLCNKIYKNISSTILLMPIPISKTESKTFSPTRFSTYESYLFKKLRTYFSLNITGLQIDSTLTSPLKKLLQGERTPLKKGIKNQVFKDLEMSISLLNNDFSAPEKPSGDTQDKFVFPKRLEHGYSIAENYKVSLTYKNKMSNIDLLEKKNILKKIPRKSVINHTYDFQAKCQFRYLEKNESKLNNHIILLKNLASNKKKEHNFIKTDESFFQKAPPENYWPTFNKLNAGLHEMSRLDKSLFLLTFYTMFFEKIQHKKMTLNTIKIFMPYRSLVVSHFLLSKADTHGFSYKNFEIVVLNKFKNFLRGHKPTE